MKQKLLILEELEVSSKTHLKWDNGTTQENHTMLSEFQNFKF